jgi:hypothetical protein
MGVDSVTPPALPQGTPIYNVTVADPDARECREKDLQCRRCVSD